MFIFSTLFLLSILKGYAFDPDVSVDCPGSFIDNVVRNVTGSLNSSVLTTGTTGNCVFGVTLVNFFFIKGNNTPDLLCTQTFSTSTNVCDQNFNANGCRCDRYVGNMFYYTYQFTANKLVQDGGVIQMKPNCLNASRQYPLVETLCNIKFESITTTTATTTPTSSDSTTAGSTSLPTTASTNTNINLSSSSVPNIATCNSTENCNQSDKCPVWCIIVVAVCVPCGGGGIIIIIVIIIKKKKAKTPGNSRPCTSPGQDENYEIEKISVTVTSQVVPDGTKTKPVNSPGPDGNIETDITYTTVIKQARHDGTKQTSNPKHTKTENEESETSAHL